MENVNGAMKIEKSFDLQCVGSQDLCRIRGSGDYRDGSRLTVNL
jgi:hypothetical protein